MDIIKYTNSKGLTIEINDSFPFRFEEILGTSGLDNQIDTIKNYSQDGKEITGASLGERTLVITGTVKGKDEDENGLENLKRQMIKVFNPKLDGILTYTIGNLTKKINCKVDSTPDYTNSGLEYAKKFKVELLCADPFWYDVAENEVNAGAYKKLLIFPLVMTNFMFGKYDLAPVTVNNLGDVETGMIIEIKAIGTASNPIITNAVTGEYMQVNRSMAAGEVITINTNKGKKKITKTLNGVTTNITNLMEYGSTFLQLDIGGNQFTGNGNNYGNMEINLKFTPKYLGV